MADEQGRTFASVHERLSQIVDEVSAQDISLDDALKLYEEAVKLGLSACDLSEQDIDEFLAAEEASEEFAKEEAATTTGSTAVQEAVASVETPDESFAGAPGDASGQAPAEDLAF